MHPLFTKAKRWLYSNSAFLRIRHFIRHVKIPFFGDLPIYKVAIFFVRGLTEGFLTTRAAAIAYNFFLAIFPAIIFLFSIIPFIPIEGFQEELITELLFAAPKLMGSFIEGTLFDVIENKHTSLVSLGFILALYFATSGINSMLTAFSMSYHTDESNMRSFLGQQFVAIGLTLSITLFLFVAIVLIIFGEHLADFMVDYITAFQDWNVAFINFARWIIIVAFVYFCVSIIYYFGQKERAHFFSPGASLATLCIILFTLVFAYYVNQFNSYNKLYGSIGTIMGIMIMIYLNSLGLLIGYELNAAIKHGSTHIKLEEY
jgi:membrane protein